MTLESLLVFASALFGVGVYGALGQSSVVMVMMGLEMMINGAIVAALSLWFFLAPASPEGPIFAIIAFTVMAIEAAMGYGVLFSLYRCNVGLVDNADELKG
jgi:NAD(P)H-quinone oxidoreductase subunit 4L